VSIEFKLLYPFIALGIIVAPVTNQLINQSPNLQYRLRFFNYTINGLLQHLLLFWRETY